jgi:hypothetical protein
MYMAVSYGPGQNDGTPHLDLSDSPNISKYFLKSIGILMFHFLCFNYCTVIL